MSRGQHEWRERAEDGRKRTIRAQHFAKQWRFTERWEGETEWIPLTEPSLEDLRALLEVLQRKYRRGRIPWEQVANLEGRIAELERASEERPT